MKYTPRQLHAFVFLTNRRVAREAIFRLQYDALAASGNAKAIKAEIKRWKKDNG